MFYTDYTTNDPKMIALLFAYCEGRSRFWQIFFGWRSVNKDKVYRFIVPTIAVKELEILEKCLDNNLEVWYNNNVS